MSKIKLVVTRRALLVFLFSCLNPFTAVGFGGSVSHETRDAIRAGLIENYSRRQSLFLEYHIVTTATKKVAASGYIRREFSTDRSGHYFYLDNGHGHDQMHWRNDPNRKLSCLSPESFDIYHPLNRMLYSFPCDDSELENLPAELILMVGWWPLEKAAERKLFGAKRSLEHIQNNDLYELRSRSESVNGRDCRILEWPGVDKLWIDVEAGHSVRRRELYDVDTGALALLVEYRDYKECQDGVYFPFSVSFQEFDFMADAVDKKSRVLKFSELEIRKIQLNENVKNRASIEVERGALKEVQGKGYILLKPGEEEHFIRIGNWGRTFFSREEGVANRHAKGFSFFGMPSYLLRLVCFLIGSVCSLMGLRFLSSRGNQVEGDKVDRHKVL